MEQAIEDLEYDLIVLSTGLIETMVASSAAADGKQVLVLDSNPFYGGMWANLNLRQLYDVLCDARKATMQDGVDAGCSDAAPPSPPSAVCVGPAPPCMSHVHISGPLDEHLVAQSSSYSIDLAPKVLFCQGPSMQQLLKSTVYNYLEFKLLGASRIWQQGQLQPVPASRADVFQNKQLSLEEKRQLMRFLKHATQEHAQVVEEDQPFTHYLQQQGLTGSMYDVALHAIAHTAASPQPPAPPHTAASPHTAAPPQPPAIPYHPDTLTTAQGLAAVHQYIQSIGVYGPASSPFLAAMYGSGEYAQAFSRLAAVKGATFVLRRGVVGVVVEEETGAVCGVQTEGGERLRCRRVVGNGVQLGGASVGVGTGGGAASTAGVPGAVDSAAANAQSSSLSIPGAPPPPPSSPPPPPPPPSCVVHRCIAIVEGVLPAFGNVVDVGCVVVCPPGAGGVGVPRVWGVVQGPGLGVCPQGRQLVYLTCTAAACSNTTPHALLHPTLQLLTQSAPTTTATADEDAAAAAGAAGTAGAAGSGGSNEGSSAASSASSSSSSSSSGAVLWSVFYCQMESGAVLNSTAATATGLSSTTAGTGVGTTTAATGLSTPTAAQLPKGVVAVPGPDATLHMDAAVACAADVYEHLFDGAQLFQGLNSSAAAGNDDSDEELMGAVQAALSLGGREQQQ